MKNKEIKAVGITLTAFVCLIRFLYEVSKLCIKSSIVFIIEINNNRTPLATTIRSSLCIFRLNFNYSTSEVISSIDKLG